MLGSVAAVWGFVGIVVLFGSAIARLSPMALSLPFSELSAFEWAALLGSLLFMGVAEGYKGFQRSFSPRVAARIRYLRDNPNPTRLLFAPLFCMGFFHATRRRQIASWSLTAGIVVLVLLVRGLPQPWRGIIDAGVVFGLSWGVVSLSVFTLMALTRDGWAHSPEVPEG